MALSTKLIAPSSPSTSRSRNSISSTAVGSSTSNALDFNINYRFDASQLSQSHSSLNEVIVWTDDDGVEHHHYANGVTVSSPANDSNKFAASMTPALETNGDDLNVTQNTHTIPSTDDLPDPDYDVETETETELKPEHNDNDDDNANDQNHTNISNHVDSTQPNDPPNTLHIDDPPDDPPDDPSDASNIPNNVPDDVPKPLNSNTKRASKRDSKLVQLSNDPSIHNILSSDQSLSPRRRKYAHHEPDDDTKLDTKHDDKQQQQLSPQHSLSRTVSIEHTDATLEVTIDRYGFPIDGDIDEKEHRKRVKKENQRLLKWQDMVLPRKLGGAAVEANDNLDDLIQHWNFVKNHRKLKSRVRKGIPQQLRGTIWQNLSGARERKKIECARYGSKNLYHDLKNRKKTKWHDQIWKDINRTYRKHVAYGSTQLATAQSNAKNTEHNRRGGSLSGSSNPQKITQEKFFKYNLHDPSVMQTPQDLEKNPTQHQIALYNVLKVFYYGFCSF